VRPLRSCFRGHGWSTLQIVNAMPPTGSSIASTGTSPRCTSNPMVSNFIPTRTVADSYRSPRSSKCAFVRLAGSSGSRRYDSVNSLSSNDRAHSRIAKNPRVSQFRYPPRSGPCPGAAAKGSSRSEAAMRRNSTKIAGTESQETFSESCSNVCFPSQAASSSESLSRPFLEPLDFPGPVTTDLDEPFHPIVTN